MKTSLNIYIIAIIAATGGLLFGFDTGVISGAIPFFQKDFGLTNNMIELVTSAGLVGAILGAISCGNITERIGRRKVILIAAVLFVLGALWSGWALDVWHLIAARLFLGIAIGISSFAVPLYLAEISPANKRGALVSLFQLMIATGILVSYLSDLYFADEADVTCWRPMFYVGVIPALVLLVGIWFMPESPRWLMSKGFVDECKSVLSRIESQEQMQKTFKSLEVELVKNREQESSSWRELFKPRFRNVLIIAVGIMFFQQFIGINTVIYYSPKIFLMAGFNSAISAIWASVGVGLVNVIFTLIAMSLVDKLGRRKLFFWGLGGIACSLILLGFSFAFLSSLGSVGVWIAVSCTFCYVAFFSLSIGPLAWLIISEVFPQKLRAFGTSIGSFSMWFFNAIVSFTFFKLTNLLTLEGTGIIVDNQDLGNPAGVFWLYGLIAIIGIVWGHYFIPETENLSLEEIEKLWTSDSKSKTRN